MDIFRYQLNVTAVRLTWGNARIFPGTRTKTTSGGSKMPTLDDLDSFFYESQKGEQWEKEEREPVYLCDIYRRA